MFEDMKLWDYIVASLILLAIIVFGKWAIGSLLDKSSKKEPD